jgi:SWI/SNF-related matrix-associated actin-dependent regulator of chromatin subfamily D
MSFGKIPLSIDWSSVDQPVTYASNVFDIQIQLHDPIRAKISQFVNGNASINKDIIAAEEKIQSLLTAIHQANLKHDFFDGFAKDPVHFLEQWTASQTRDLEVIYGDLKVNQEESRKSQFYSGEWVDKAIFHYLNAKSV